MTISGLIPRIAAVLLAAVLLSAGSSGASADRRVALVIGNSAYKAQGAALSNPKNDAQDTSEALRDLGYDVLSVTDASKRDFDLALAKFARMATGADSALFFYAGHGMQYQGRNYLMPVDAELEDDVSMRYQMTSLEDVREALDRAEGVKVMILDACRNNPLADRMQKSNASRSVGGARGLARVDKSQGSIIVYATAADQVAQDGAGRNSPFTAAMLKRLREPGLEIEMMFRRVSADVATATNGRQRPETTVSLQAEFYLNQNDIIAWEKMKDHDEPAALRDFIAKFPSSQQAAHARDRLDKVERERRAPALAQATAAAIAPSPRQRAPASEQALAAPAPPDRSPAAAGTPIRFADPLKTGPFPVNGQSIETLASLKPLFPPIEGLDEKVWKLDCGSCHKWDRQTLCKQGQTYVGDPAMALRNRHPYGGPFKVALMEWARTGCQ